jgi:transposase
VAESYAAGAVVSEVARRHDMSAQHLFGWRRDARHQTRDGAAACSMGFASVIVDARAEALASSGPCGRSPVIEIVIGGATKRRLDQERDRRAKQGPGEAGLRAHRATSRSSDGASQFGPV